MGRGNLGKKSTTTFVETKGIFVKKKFTIARTKALIKLLLWIEEILVKKVYVLMYIMTKFTDG